MTVCINTGLVRKILLPY